MKKLTTLLTLALVGITITSLCAEKNWLATKIDTITKKIADRHTYQYGSFEHIRDMATLFCLPAHVSQSILEQQRKNMISFLEKNEEKALKMVPIVCNLDDETWSKIMTTIKRESDFTLNAMKSEGSNNNSITYDATLPKDWITALKHECTRHNIHPENLKFCTTMNPEIAASLMNRSNLNINQYHPAEVHLNLAYWDKLKQKDVCFIATHELTHTIKNHSLVLTIILEEIFFKHIVQHEASRDEAKCLAYSAAITDLRAAQEKTADTLVTCTDPKAAENAAYFAQKSIRHGLGLVSQENYNDMRVIDANWKVTQAITNFQRQKNWIMQKLIAFPKFFA